MTVMGTIKCCKDCKKPKHHEGCHATCGEYLKEKKAHDDYNEKVREGRKEQSAGLSEHMLTHTHHNGKQRKKGQP